MIHDLGIILTTSVAIDVLSRTGDIKLAVIESENILIAFFRKENILISQLLHRLMHMAVHYYKRTKSSSRNLKHEVLSHEYNKILKRKD